MSARSIPIYPANLATFEESWIFGAPFGLIWAPAAPKTQYDVIYNFMAIIFFSLLRIFYDKMATSEGGSSYPYLWQGR